jgi:hypothetical protein
MGRVAARDSVLERFVDSKKIKRPPMASPSSIEGADESNDCLFKIITALEDRGRRTEGGGGRRMEDSGWRRTEDGGQRTNDGVQRMDDRGWRVEGGGGGRTEDGDIRQRMEEEDRDLTPFWKWEMILHCWKWFTRHYF